MIPFLLLGAAAIATGIVVAAYWKEIRAWITRVMDKLPESVKENLQGAMAFVEKIGATIKNLMVYYSYNQKTEKWNETTVSKEVSESEIPAHIREQFKARNKVDTTTETQEQLLLMQA